VEDDLKKALEAAAQVCQPLPVKQGLERGVVKRVWHVGQRVVCQELGRLRQVLPARVQEVLELLHGTCCGGRVRVVEWSIAAATVLVLHRCKPRLQCEADM